MKISRDPAVDVEILDFAKYIARDNPAASLRFIKQCKVTFEHLAIHPYLGSRLKFKNRKLEKIRVWPVRSFKQYLIFYVPQKNEIKILHILHSARDILEIL